MISWGFLTKSQAEVQKNPAFYYVSNVWCNYHFQESQWGQNSLVWTAYFVFIVQLEYSLVLDTGHLNINDKK